MTNTLHYYMRRDFEGFEASGHCWYATLQHLLYKNGRFLEPDTNQERHKGTLTTHQLGLPKQANLSKNITHTRGNTLIVIILHSAILLGQGYLFNRLKALKKKQLSVIKPIIIKHFKQTNQSWNRPKFPNNYFEDL